MKYMMRFYLVLLASGALAVPAFAQDNTIRVIQEDGSVVVFDLGGRALEKAPAAAEVAPESMPESVESVVKKDAPPKAPDVDLAPQTASPEPVVETEDVPSVPSKPEEQKTAAPEPAPVKTSSPPQKVLPKAHTKAPVEAKSETVLAYVPLPGRKPPAPAGFGVATQTYDDGVEESSDGAVIRLITKEQAKAIAVTHAPPSKSMIVQNRVLDDQKIYAVIFKTEDGPFEVLVSETGTVLRAR